jgi:hypothetical protein
MNRFNPIKGLLAGLAAAVLIACDPTVVPLQPGNDPEKPDPVPPGTEQGQTPPPASTDPYANIGNYGPLKSYLDRGTYPHFRLGVAVDGNVARLYDLAGENFMEMTAGNAMKYGSVVRSDGTMNFNGVTSFLNAAESRGLTVYGHTLAWHSQQQPGYLNGLIKDQYVERPGDPGELVLLESDFNGG